MGEVDLHTHSIVSDGSDTPAGLAVKAKSLGLRAFALTDHDSISGLEEVRTAAAKVGIEFLNGMELTVEYRGHKLHIICLGFDPEHSSFKAIYRKVRAIKEGSIPEIIDFIKDKGVDISVQKVLPYAHNGILDLYAIMRYLVSLHIRDRVQALWDEFLDPAAVELGLNYSITAEEALPLIREAGGVTSLAHFHKEIGLKWLDTRKEQEQAILRLHALGLDGMERYYTNYTADDAAFASYMIDKYQLLATGGTDYHGLNRQGVELGCGAGNLSIPYDIVSDIKKVLATRHSR